MTVLAPHDCPAAGSGLRTYRLTAGRDQVLACERCRQPLALTRPGQNFPPAGSSEPTGDPMPDVLPDPPRCPTCGRRLVEVGTATICPRCDSEGWLAAR